ncbi:MAG: hypothetical protein CM15mP85_27740 [Rhodobacterales bacterium]|nr:MAG: hypothetical protein CM15mP85_27740 [Rhodobacterales bacterium]
MFKFLNYVRTIISFLIFSLLSACGDNGSFFNNRISGEDYGGTKEAKLIKYYSRLEERKISLGLLRQDGGGADTPFDVDDIVEAFEQVAFYNEYDISGNKLLPNSEAVKLAKWKSNINISVRFGNSVDKKQKEKDLLEINELIGNLSDITDHNIEISQQNENMYIVIANRKEIKDLIGEIGLTHPEFDPTRIPIITQLPKDIHCMAMTSMSSEPNSAISSALVIIRSELPAIMRRACFHEEIAQSFGLTNDSHLARPSVFNDDDEFATLTKFDEILLQILYDHRLNPGISKREASQLVRQIANEINIDL